MKPGRSWPSRPRLLIGARLVFRDGTPDILAYPKDRKAYARLSRLISVGKLRAEKGECLLDFADLLQYRRGLADLMLNLCIAATRRSASGHASCASARKPAAA